MFQVYCFFNKHHSHRFRHQIYDYLKFSDIGRDRIAKKIKFDEDHDFGKIIEKILNLKNNQFILVFHPKEKARSGFQLQVFTKDLLFKNDRYETLYDCNLHLLRDGYFTSQKQDNLLFTRLQWKDYFTTFDNDELILSILNSSSNRNEEVEDMFNYVEDFLLKSRNYNYLLSQHKLSQSDLLIRKIIDEEYIKRDQLVLSRFFRLKEKEIEGKNAISNKNEFKHVFVLETNINSSRLLVDFDFTKNALRKTRIITMVGKNATGKSQTLLQIAKNDSLNYQKNTFLYGFDEKGNGDNKKFKYVNLIKTKNDNIKEDIGRIIDLDKNVFYFERIKLLKDVSNNVLGIDDIVVLTDDGDFVSLFTQDTSIVHSVLKVEVIPRNSRFLSTGQSYFLRLVVSFIANIKYSSLLLIDEPEVFLHPNYIKELILILERVLSYTNSVCVLSTHSVFVVREMPREYVKVLSRDRITGESIIRVPALETFGESLDILAEDIFHDEDIEGFGEKYVKKDKINIKLLSSRMASRVINHD